MPLSAAIALLTADGERMYMSLPLNPASRLFALPPSLSVEEARDKAEDMYDLLCGIRAAFIAAAKAPRADGAREAGPEKRTPITAATKRIADGVARLDDLISLVELPAALGEKRYRQIRKLYLDASGEIVKGAAEIEQRLAAGGGLDATISESDVLGEGVLTTHGSPTWFEPRNGPDGRAGTGHQEQYYAIRKSAVTVAAGTRQYTEREYICAQRHGWVSAAIAYGVPNAHITTDLLAREAAYRFPLPGEKGKYSDLPAALRRSDAGTEEGK